MDADLDAASWPLTNVPERVWFDPSTRSHVYERRWLFSEISLMILVIFGIVVYASQQDIRLGLEGSGGEGGSAA